MELLIGSVISLVVEAAKKYLKTDFERMAALLILAFTGGVVVFYLKQVGLFETVLQVLAYAAAFWALIIRRFTA